MLISGYIDPVIYIGVSFKRSFPPELTPIHLYVMPSLVKSDGVRSRTTANCRGWLQLAQVLMGSLSNKESIPPPWKILPIISFFSNKNVSLRLFFVYTFFGSNCKCKALNREQPHQRFNQHFFQHHLHISVSHLHHKETYLLSLVHFLSCC